MIGYQTAIALNGRSSRRYYRVYSPASGTTSTGFLLIVAPMSSLPCGESNSASALCVRSAGLSAWSPIRLCCALRKRDDCFANCASGLALVIGLQAFINMGVSLSILPAKA